AAVGQLETVEDRANLNRHVAVAHHARPDGLTRPPFRGDFERVGRVSVVVEQRHRDWPIQLAVHNHATTDTISNIDDAALREGYSPPRHLTCDLPPSAVVEVINGSGDGCQNLQLFPSGGPGLEAVGILLLNE